VNAIFTPTATNTYKTVTVEYPINVIAPSMGSGVIIFTYGYGDVLNSKNFENVPGFGAIPGSFAWNSPNKVLTTMGVANERMTFTPSDTTLYDSAEFNIRISVGKGTPTFQQNEIVITYGSKLAQVIVDYDSSVPGTVSWDTDDAALLGSVGKHTVAIIFTPDDTVNYNSVYTTVEVTVIAPTHVGTYNHDLNTKLSDIDHQESLDIGHISGSYEWEDGDHVFSETGTFTKNLIFTPDHSDHSPFTMAVMITIADNSGNGGDDGGDDNGGNGDGNGGDDDGNGSGNGNNDGNGGDDNGGSGDGNGGDDNTMIIVAIVAAVAIAGLAAAYFLFIRKP